MRLHLVIAIGLAGTLELACGDALSAPQDPEDPLAAVVGSYTLLTWNGVAIPYATATIEANRGSLRLNSDSTWRSTFVFRFTQSTGSVTEKTNADSGIYVLHNDSLRFFQAGLSISLMRGAISGDTLTTVRTIPQPAPISEEVMVYTK